jgi:hypothetical protein
MAEEKSKLENETKSQWNSSVVTKDKGTAEDRVASKIA